MKLLVEYRVRDEVCEWVGSRSLEQAWKECDRADLMLYLLGAMAGTPGWPTQEQVVLMAADCAETVQHLAPAGDERPRKLLAAARAWAAGTATHEEYRADVAAGVDADSTYIAAGAYAYYADAAAPAYAAVAAAIDDPRAAAYAARAAAAAYARAKAGAYKDAYREAAKQKLRELADLIRPRFTPVSEHLGL